MATANFTGNMKQKIKLLILSAMITVSCATADLTVIDIQHKILADKYTKNNDYFFRFYDGTVLKVDETTYLSFQSRETIKLTWRKK